MMAPRRLEPDDRIPAAAQHDVPATARSAPAPPAWSGDRSVIVTSGAEQITLTHRASSRAVFAQGARPAAQWRVGRPPGRYKLRDYLAA